MIFGRHILYIALALIAFVVALWSVGPRRTFSAALLALIALSAGAIMLQQLSVGR